ncbi:hypothetical protein V2J09_022496 [Rumex salicifolius]
MMMEFVNPTTEPVPNHHPPQLVIAAPGDSGSGGDNDPESIAALSALRSAITPKKRSETWVQEETRSLISLRRDMDSLFNTSKSNKHLWEQISSKMRDKGFDRSPTMCTDKWRNLLKEFKKAKQKRNTTVAGGGDATKMSYYKEIDEILRERSRTAASYKSPNNTVSTASGSTKLNSFLQFSDKGIEDSSIPYGPIEGMMQCNTSEAWFGKFLGKKGIKMKRVLGEGDDSQEGQKRNTGKKQQIALNESNGLYVYVAANERQTLNLERSLDHDGHPLAITAADTVGATGVPPSFWRETPGNGEETHTFEGRVITVKWGDYTRRIGIDGTADAISHAIKSAFGIRTKRAFWLEDEDQVVRCLDRGMPLGNYTLHLDDGMTVKVCHYDESEHIPLHTEEKTFYCEDDLRDFLQRRGWLALRELHGYRSADHLDDLRCDALYRGVT